MMVEPTFVIKTEEEREDYGIFTIEPLEQGYGQTLGNSLRRVLLSSLPGAAVTSVKIDGVKHQFSTLPGLKEDIIELLLNIKKLHIRSTSDEPVTVSLSKKGEGSFTAGDIEAPAGVTIVNKDLVLGTLADKKSEITLQFTVQKGYGFVTAEEHAVDEVGVISVDSIFSPVVRVNYRVASTRVGRMTNLDKLVLEIFTNGTMKPSDALTSAAKILVSYFTQIVEPKTQAEKPSVVEKPAVSDEILKMRIEELDIPTRIVNALANGGIETVAQLVGTPRSELMKIKNLGGKSLSVVEEKLKDKGVILA